MGDLPALHGISFVMAPYHYGLPRFMAQVKFTFRPVFASFSVQPMLLMALPQAGNFIGRIKFIAVEINK